MKKELLEIINIAEAFYDFPLEERELYWKILQKEETIKKLLKKIDIFFIIKNHIANNYSKILYIKLKDSKILQNFLKSELNNIKKGDWYDRNQRN